MIKLWSINRAIRWLGFVLVIECDSRPDDDPERRPSRIGFVWTGWPPDRGWARHCERSRARFEASIWQPAELRGVEPIRRCPNGAPCPFACRADCVDPFGSEDEPTDPGMPVEDVK